VQIEYSSELRYRAPLYREGTIVLGISQSGETADTLAVLRDARSRGIPTLGITNVRSSTVARESDAALFTSAGPEIGVAATKTFTSQLVSMLLVAGSLASKNPRIGADERATLFDQVLRLPHLLEGLLSGTHFGNWPAGIEQIASRLASSRGFFFMGRGLSFPLALEGALKLKEIAYTHAEGYAAGELKHGPIAMIDKEMAVVVVAPRDAWREKTLSNLEEVKARGAVIVGIGSAGDERMRSLCDHWIPIPETDSSGQALDLRLTPFLLTPALQLLSYHLALLKGTDIDQPRNLAKSVTVE
jgi:glucosamine--fructose-6-phosphate aminotransferase (isomerizing)